MLPNTIFVPSDDQAGSKSLTELVDILHRALADRGSEGSAWIEPNRDAFHSEMYALKEYSRSQRDKTGPGSGFRVDYLQGDNDWPAVMAALDDIVFDVVVSTVEGLPRARRRDADATAESVRRAVRAVLNEHWGKKPICLVHVLTI